VFPQNFHRIHRQQFLLSFFVGLKVIELMNNGDFTGEFGDEESFFDGGVSAPDDDNFLILENTWRRMSHSS
jgi:hypothetical protein